MDRVLPTEEAPANHARREEAERNTDPFAPFAETCGTWQRDEAPEESVQQACAVFEASMTRYRP